jgi:hypothetical protein
MRLFGDGKHGQAERIQTVAGLPHHVQPSRRHCFSLLNTPSHQVAGVLSALAQGLDPSAAERVAGLSRRHQHEPFCPVLAGMPIPCTSASSALSPSRSCSETSGAHGSAGPPRCCGGGWPSTRAHALLPVMSLGPRTHQVAHLLIDSLRQLLAAGCLLLFTREGLTCSLSALTAHVGHWLTASRRGRNVQKRAGGGGLDRWPGEAMLPRRQADTGLAGDAPGNRDRSQSRLREIGPLWEVEERLS